MAYPNSQRVRKIDWFSNMYWSDEKTAYDQIIENPETHLLSQRQLFSEEGGVLGLLTQLTVMGGSVAALLVYKPSYTKYLLQGNLRFYEWLSLAAVGVTSYRAGYYLGYTLFGDSSKLHAHWAAFHYQKTQNRFEGRINLMKAPKMF